MQDSFGRLLDLIILLVVALIVPVATVSGLAKRTAQIHTKKIGREFLKNVESFGTVSLRDMERLEDRLCDSGAEMTVRLTKRSVLFAPANDGFATTDGRIGEEDVIRFFRETPSGEIEEMLERDGLIEFDRGDLVRLEISERGGRDTVYEGETTVLAFPSEETSSGDKPAE